MKKMIPKKERWLHTPEMKAKLARADEWMRENPPRETDLDELERQLDRKEKMTQSDKAKKWMAENAKAIECWNRHVEEHGLPLAEHCSFLGKPEEVPMEIGANDPKARAS
ncbi:MAG: hypothetical protein RL651_1462 [Pseudomonadota bacterium]|jgi:hypothetical protein